MQAILTGDLVNSRKADPDLWLPDVKLVLNRYGKELTDWEIYRGDSFQIATAPDKALELALLVKAVCKQHKLLDARIAIGIGEISYRSGKITQSNGTAFVNSGECFEALKKQTLGIRTPWENFNATFQIILQLVSQFSDNWTVATSEVIAKALENPEANQKQLADLLDRKSQSSISEALKRGGYEEIKSVIGLYKTEIGKLC